MVVSVSLLHILAVIVERSLQAIFSLIFGGAVHCSSCKVETLQHC